MATTIPVETNLFTDKWFRNLTDKEKLLFLYFFINPSIPPSGIFEIDPEIVAFMLKIEDFAKTIGALKEKVVFDEEKNIVWVKNFYRKNYGKGKYRNNKNILTNVRNTLTKFENSFIVGDFKNQLEEAGEVSTSEAPSEVIAITTTNSIALDNNYKESTASEPSPEVNIPPTLKQPSQKPANASPKYYQPSYMYELGFDGGSVKTVPQKLSDDIDDLIIQTYVEKPLDKIHKSTLKGYYEKIIQWTKDTGYSKQNLLEIVTNYTLFFNSGKAGDFPKAAFANFLKKDDYSKWLDEFDPENLKSPEEKKAKHEQILDMDFDSVFEGELK